MTCRPRASPTRKPERAPDAVVIGALNLTVDHALRGSDARPPRSPTTSSHRPRGSWRDLEPDLRRRSLRHPNAKLPDVTGDVSLKSTAMANNTSLTIDKMGAGRHQPYVSNRDPRRPSTPSSATVDGASDVAATAVKQQRLRSTATSPHAALSQCPHAAPVSAVPMSTSKPSPGA